MYKQIASFKSQLEEVYKMHVGLIEMNVRMESAVMYVACGFTVGLTVFINYKSRRIWLHDKRSSTTKNAAGTVVIVDR